MTQLAAGVVPCKFLEVSQDACSPSLGPTIVLSLSYPKKEHPFNFPEASDHCGFFNDDWTCNGLIIEKIDFSLLTFAYLSHKRKYLFYR